MSFLGMGTFEILVILLVAFIFLGPERMIDAARTLGKWTGELRRMGSTVQAEMDDLANVGAPLSSRYSQPDGTKSRDPESPPLDQDHPAEPSEPAESSASQQDDAVARRATPVRRTQSLSDDTQPSRREDST